MHTQTQTQTRPQTSGATVPAIAVIATFVVGFTALHIWLHYRTHGVFNGTQIALSFFLVVNALIAFWEMALYFSQDKIQAEYNEYRKSYRGREIEACAEVFSRPIPITRLLSFDEWTRVWSSYSLFDSGYSDRRSFGYNIDVGNGFTTIIPATLFTFSMTFEFIPPRVLGIIGVIIFWQMFYGVAVYFFQFFNSGRQKGHSVKDIVVVIGVSNAAWAIFPLIGLWASIELILSGNYSIFH